MPNGAELAARYVALHNRGRRMGEWSSLVALFAPDAEMSFVGIPFGPLRSAQEIRDAFESHAPDDDLVLLSVTPGDGALVVVYAWSKEPAVAAGTLRFELAGSRIARLVVSAGASEA